MLKSITMHKKDSKGKVKSNFVISCFDVRGSIPINKSFICKKLVT